MRRCADKAGDTAGCVMSACGACVAVVVSEYESKIKHLQESHDTLRKVAHALGTCYCWDYGCEPAGVDDLLFRVHDLLDLECEKLDRDFEPKPSRREQRRARKAAKNLYMFKNHGKRPWDSIRVIGPLWEDAIGFERLYPPLSVVVTMRGELRTFKSRYDQRHESRMKHLREPSGFKAMSMVADALIETESREPGCQCQWEAGDSPCRMHGENAEATP